MNFKKSLILFVPLVLAFSLVFSISSTDLNKPDVSLNNANPDYRSEVSVYHNGELISQGSNEFLTTGQEWLVGQIGDTTHNSGIGSTTDYVDNVSVGAGASNSDYTSTYSTDTLSWQEGTDTNYINTTHEFTASSEATLNATRLTTSDGVEFAFETFSEVPLQEDDQITVEWEIWTQ